MVLPQAGACGYVKFNRFRGCRLNEKIRYENEKLRNEKNVKTNSDDSENKPERFEFHIAVGGLREAQENLRNEKRKKERP